MPGQVVVRGPGNGLVGYCAINSTATTTSSPALPLRATTRAASEVPVEVAINPTSASFTTASGITVPAGTYEVVFTPVGKSPVTLSGTLPTVPAGLYPSSWLTSSGIPQQLAFGWVASTGGSTDFHEIDAANVVSFTPVPQLAVTQTAYSAASPALGAPVTYTVNPSVSSSGSSESSAVSVSETMPAGVTPVGAYGSGWTCGAPSGQVITCTDSADPVRGRHVPAAAHRGGHRHRVGGDLVDDPVRLEGDGVLRRRQPRSGHAPRRRARCPTGPSGVTVSPATGAIAGGNDVTVSGTNISGATAIEIGTTSQQQAGTPVVLLPCASGSAAGLLHRERQRQPRYLLVARRGGVRHGERHRGHARHRRGGQLRLYDKPGTPAAPTATAGITSATVTWVAPASNNSPITGYIVTPYLNGVAQTPVSYGASTTTQTLTGLTAGASYTFTVTAVNAIGTGAASPQSAAVVPYALPGAPTIGVGQRGRLGRHGELDRPGQQRRQRDHRLRGHAVHRGRGPDGADLLEHARPRETVTGLTAGTSYTFKVAAVNAAGTGPASAASAAVTPNAGPSLTFGPPPAGEASIAYSDQLTATGGTGTLTWSVSSGSLPPGLTLNSSTGLLSGTPTAAGSYPFTVKITDTTGGTATKAVTLVIAAAPSLANPAPPSGQAGVAYSDALAVTGGTGPFTWAVSGGSLPPGLTLNASTGLLSGTPTDLGLYSFTVKVTDAFGLTATQSLNMTVAVGPLVINATANASTVAQGGTLGYTITVTNTAATAYSGRRVHGPAVRRARRRRLQQQRGGHRGHGVGGGADADLDGQPGRGRRGHHHLLGHRQQPLHRQRDAGLHGDLADGGHQLPGVSTDARCSVSVPVSALTITQTARRPRRRPARWSATRSP